MENIETTTRKVIRIPVKKTFLITMIVSLSISALIGIAVFLLGVFEETELKLLMTTLTIGGFSLTGLCCSVLYEKRRFIPLAILGMMVSFLGFIFTSSVIWGIIDWQVIYSSHLFEILITFVILATSTAQACLLLLIRSEKMSIDVMLAITLVFVLIVALMLIFLVFNIYNHIGEFYFRILGVFVILDFLGTVITPILKKIYLDDITEKNIVD